MEKAGVRTRDIQFYSEKNQQMICVHSRRARDFAKHLEQQSWVANYKTCVPLDINRFHNVNPVDIRREYLALQWTTDFVIHTADGQIAVREFADPKDFSKKALVEKLELSRRYWAILDISDWKLVVSSEAITNKGRCAS